ncbi:MAG TPA: ADYC domain-containing protein [Nannocystis sp.]
MIGLVSVAVAVTMMPACDEPQREAEGSCACGEIETRGLQQNGMVLNGMVLNGMVLNGMVLNGTLLGNPSGDEYVTLEKIILHGKGAASEAWLEGSNLVVKAKDGTLVSGDGLDSAKLKFEIRENGVTQKKTLKILDAKPLAPGSDVWVYDITIQVQGGPWQPLCLDSAGEPTQAILLGDTWSPETGARRAPLAGALTFACRDAALAKCVEWGYRPWSTAGGMSLRDFHQACTRLVRADYCGDGTSHTFNGTPVHALDEVGVQAPEPGATFAVEAEWNADGAVCLNTENMRAGAQELGCEIPACGSAFASGGLLQSGKIVAGP